MVGFVVLPWWFIVGDPIYEEEGLLDGWIFMDSYVKKGGTKQS
jgi:hypothetical protein